MPDISGKVCNRYLKPGIVHPRIVGAAGLFQSGIGCIDRRNGIVLRLERVAVGQDAVHFGFNQPFAGYRQAHDEQ
ncbi:hypothetical protein D3C87_2025510 [compost metagenome]